MSSIHLIPVLRELQNNAKRRAQGMAHAVGISEPNFSKVRSEAEGDGTILRTVAVLDPSRLGFDAIGILLISTSKPSVADGVAKILATWPETQDVHMLIGLGMLHVKVCVRTPKELFDLEQRVRGLAGVIGVRTEPVGTTYKASLHVPI